jgi:hypothetical protein
MLALWFRGWLIVAASVATSTFELRSLKGTSGVIGAVRCARREPACVLAFSFCDRSRRRMPTGNVSGSLVRHTLNSGLGTVLAGSQHRGNSVSVPGPPHREVPSAHPSIRSSGLTIFSALA